MGYFLIGETKLKLHEATAAKLLIIEVRFLPNKLKEQQVNNMMKVANMNYLCFLYYDSNYIYAIYNSNICMRKLFLKHLRSSYFWGLNHIRNYLAGGTI